MLDLTRPGSGDQRQRRRVDGVAEIDEQRQALRPRQRAHRGAPGPGPVHAPERRIGGAPVGELPGHEAPGVAVLLDPRPLRRLHQMMVAAQLPACAARCHAAGIAIVDARRRDLRRPGARQRIGVPVGRRSHGVLAREEHHATLARCAHAAAESLVVLGEVVPVRLAPRGRRHQRRERRAQSGDQRIPGGSVRGRIALAPGGRLRSARAAPPRHARRSLEATSPAREPDPARPGLFLTGTLPRAPAAGRRSRP